MKHIITSSLCKSSRGQSLSPAHNRAALRLRHSLAAMAAAVLLPAAALAASPSVSTVGDGYAGTSVNTAVFRTNSLVTHDSTQYVAYYDPEGVLTLGKRQLGSDRWTTSRTQYKGNVRDAHNVISLGVDGRGYLHVSFDHHGHPLHYARSVAPGSLLLGPLQSMTGIDEDNVTYPEFYNLTDGGLLFVYRSGASGRGNMAINRYDPNTCRWQRVQDKLIDGEEQRSPYWQVYVDANDVIHVSWVWRETWMVETNHDMCYARSLDGGRSWERSDGTPYSLPITAANAEYAWKIPQKSELINQTSMTADAKSHPYIVTYWRDPDATVPQYRMIWHDGDSWQQRAITQRTTPFSLAGGGTKMIPISRPRMVVNDESIAVIYRDAERGSRVSMATADGGPAGLWTTTDLTDYSVEAWEPTLDPIAWRQHGILSIFVQQTLQGDGERALKTAPTPVRVLDLRP